MKTRSPWARFGKFINLVVLLAFFLPFFGVSCDGIDVITVSGADMAFGCKPGGAISAAEEEAGNRGMGSELSGEIKVDKVSVEPLAIIALLVAVAGVVLAFLSGKKFVQAAILTSALTIGSLVGLWLKVGGDIDTQIGEKMQSQLEGQAFGRGSKVESGARMGLWLALVGAVAAIGVAATALRRPEEVPEVVPPGGPDVV